MDGSSGDLSLDRCTVLAARRSAIRELRHLESVVLGLDARAEAVLEGEPPTAALTRDPNLAVVVFSVLEQAVGAEGERLVSHVGRDRNAPVAVRAAAAREASEQRHPPLRSRAELARVQIRRRAR
jgi:hypothetical protein